MKLIRFGEINKEKPGICIDGNIMMYLVLSMIMMKYFLPMVAFHILPG